MGIRLKKARERLNMSQEELADIIGKTQNAVSNYENGKRSIPTSELPELAKALDIPIAYFFGDIEPDQELIEVYNRLSPKAREMALAYLHLLENEFS